MEIILISGFSILYFFMIYINEVFDRSESFNYASWYLFEILLSISSIAGAEAIPYLSKTVLVFQSRIVPMGNTAEEHIFSKTVPFRRKGASVFPKVRFLRLPVYEGFYPFQRSPFVFIRSCRYQNHILVFNKLNKLLCYDTFWDVWIPFIWETILLGLSFPNCLIFLGWLSIICYTVSLLSHNPQWSRLETCNKCPLIGSDRGLADCTFFGGVPAKKFKIVFVFFALGYLCKWLVRNKKDK